MASVILSNWEKSDADDDTRTVAAIIMPDHTHWLFELGSRLPLSRVIAKFKSQTRKALIERDSAWEDNFFERRLRPEEDYEHYAQYIFLNPYRADLIGIGLNWPYWHCPEPDRLAFTEHLRKDGTPPPQWVGEIKKPFEVSPARGSPP